MDTLIQKLAFTVAESTVVSGLSRSKIYEEIARGLLPSVKAGGRRLILRADLEEYLLRQRSVRGNNSGRLIDDHLGERRTRNVE
jgi:excisionase family DNA binding protein